MEDMGQPPTKRQRLFAKKTKRKDILIITICLIRLVSAELLQFKRQFYVVLDIVVIWETDV